MEAKVEAINKEKVIYRRVHAFWNDNMSRLTPWQDMGTCVETHILELFNYFLYRFIAYG